MVYVSIEESEVHSHDFLDATLTSWLQIINNDDRIGRFFEHPFVISDMPGNPILNSPEF